MATDKTTVEVDADIQGFSDDQLAGCINLSRMMLRDPGLAQERRETLTKRLGMFLDEKAVRDDTANTLDAWARIVEKQRSNV